MLMPKRVKYRKMQRGRIKGLAQRGNPYTLIGSDPTGRMGIDFGVTGAPETFVIDGHGRVRYRHVGPITPEVWSGTLQPMLDRLEQET